MSVSRFWFNFQKAKISLAAVPKCGNTSVKKAAGEIRRAQRTEYPIFDTKYALVRHPVSRFASFYANKILGQGNKPQGSALYAELRTSKTPEDVFNKIQHDIYQKAGFPERIDGHWKPISWHLSHENGGNGAILVPLYELGTILENAPEHNKTKSEDVLDEMSDELKERIECFYAEDLRLWRESLKTDVQSLRRITRNG